ncbi:bifunctional DNA primase/polymerase [Sneathiella sp. HT1-7]|uniref:bifunctional DNA primase/polymerase n=1 Tax=Sneathiella sp. HT1-7 TaxID=2887192 RepID=UPI001D14ED8E|nr:bifunctional DNA primase/polymerase [Sneathiella sp. HT1-7]MCC3304205.1 bifunctional DNA primase/polymerase [Sneathiella sp. HT1-7]
MMQRKSPNSKTEAPSDNTFSSQEKSTPGQPENQELAANENDVTSGSSLLQAQKDFPSLSQQEVELLCAAVNYAALGWPVFPVHSVNEQGDCSCGAKDCKNAGKHPKTLEGHKAATSDIETVKRWWSGTHVGANIGCWCKAGFWTLDVDPRDDGDKKLATLEKKYGKLPATVTSLTGGNGFHFLFRKKPVCEYRGKVIGEDGHSLIGLDIKAYSGYIVLPPSNHASSGKYRWKEGHGPGEMDVAEAPQWLEDLCVKGTPVPPSPEPQRAGGHSHGHGGRFSDDQIADMLSRIDPDCSYDDWVTVGMALHSEGRRFELWRDWSTDGSKYVDVVDCEKHWSTFKVSGGIKFATLIHMATERGWVPPWQRDLPTPANLNIPKYQNEVIEKPTNLLNPPGITKDIAGYLTDVGVMPQPIFGVAGALCLMAVSMGNGYANETGIRPNIMTVAVGPTSCGKDAARKGIKELLGRAGKLSLIAAEDVTSGAAIETALSREPNSLGLFDEFGMMLKAINDPNGAGHLKDISSTLMKMFSSSGSRYIGKAYADRDNKTSTRRDIDYPCFSIYGTTTGEMLDKALGSADAQSGYLNRLLVVETDTPIPEQKNPRPLNDVPEEVVNWIEEVADKAAKGEPSMPIIVAKTDTAREAMGAYSRKILSRRRSLAEDWEQALWGRSIEQTEKIAMILAVGVDQEKPQVTVEQVEWAVDFVEWSTSKLILRLRDNVADTMTEGKLKKFLKNVRNAADYVGDKRYGRACSKGVMPHSKALILSKLDKQDFDRVAATAVARDEVQIVEMSKEVHGLTGAAYIAL